MTTGRINQVTTILTATSAAGPRTRAGALSDGWCSSQGFERLSNPTGQDPLTAFRSAY